MSAARVAVVLVSYEACAPLLEALAALPPDPELPLETVVVDNASSDGTTEAVRARFPTVRVIANPDNRGFAVACNQGVRETRAPLLLFLNPDAVLAPGALATLVGLAESRPRVGVVGPRTRSANGDIQVSTGPDLSLWSEWRQRRLVLGVARREAERLAEAEALHGVEHQPDWVSGACLLARREALEAVSGFDERFFLYEEDADLCRRVRAAGWQVLFTPAAEVRHTRGVSMAKDPERARREYDRSHRLYYRKHCGFVERAVLSALLAARA